MSTKLIIVRRTRSPGKPNTLAHNVFTALFLAPFTLPFVALTLEIFGGR